MKVILQLENKGDNQMLGVPDNVKTLQGRVTAVIIRKEVVPTQIEPLHPLAHTPYVDKAYIELEIDSLKDMEREIPEIGWNNHE